MELLKPYDVDIFNRTRSLGSTDRKFHSNNGPVVIGQELQDLFNKYPHMADKFGVVLVHRHFDLLKNQVLVDVNGSAMAWTLDDLNATTSIFYKHGGQIMPKSWLLSDNKLMPYEFYFVPPVLKANNATRSCNIEFDPDFVKEFAHILDAHNLTSILGLYLLQAVEGEIVELTEGNANITFTVPSVSDFTSRDIIQASWSYEAVEINSNIGGNAPIFRRGCVKSACYKVGSGDNTTHTHSHNEEDSDDD